MYKRALVLCAHTDDLEFGCGGTIARMIDDGTDVFVVVYSLVNPSINPPGILEEEWEMSMDVMGIKPDKRLAFDLPMRELSGWRQPILEGMVYTKTRINPDIVFIPSLQDIHQDHQVIAQEGLRAFKDRTLLGYELAWNNLTFQTTHFVEITVPQLEKKVECLMQYHSQIGKKYIEPGYIRALAITRGHQVGLDYAECFEVYRWVVTV